MAEITTFDSVDAKIVQYGNRFWIKKDVPGGGNYEVAGSTWFYDKKPLIALLRSLGCVVTKDKVTWRKPIGALPLRQAIIAFRTATDDFFLATVAYLKTPSNHLLGLMNDAQTQYASARDALDQSLIANPDQES